MYYVNQCLIILANLLGLCMFTTVKAQYHVYFCISQAHSLSFIYIPGGVAGLLWVVGFSQVKTFSLYMSGAVYLSEFCLMKVCALKRCVNKLSSTDQQRFGSFSFLFSLTLLNTTRGTNRTCEHHVVKIFQLQSGSYEWRKVKHLKQIIWSDLILWGLHELRGWNYETSQGPGWLLTYKLRRNWK